MAINSWLMTDSAGEQVPADMSLAYGVLLWVGAPIAVVAALPILTGLFKALTKSWASPLPNLWLLSQFQRLGVRVASLL
jgi:hypothetical protein